MPLLKADLRLILREADISGMRLGFPRALAEEPEIAAAVAKLEAAGARIVPVNFDPPDLVEEGQFMGAEMVRDLALYLADYAGPAAQIRNILDLQLFNLENPDVRVPYGQSLIDMMAGFTEQFDGNPEGLVRETERLSAMVSAQTGGYLEALFANKKIDALIRINNSGASAGAFANYPAITLPAGYRESGQPVGITLYAPPFQEQRLIDLAGVLEAAGQMRRPPQQYLP